MAINFTSKPDLNTFTASPCVTRLLLIPVQSLNGVDMRRKYVEVVNTGWSLTMNKSAFNVQQLTCLTKSLVVLCLLIACLPVHSTAAAQSDDQFDGAVWRFVMKPKFKGESESKGGFRVLNNELFQKETPKDEEFTKKIGTNHPNGDRTVMKLKEFRYFAISDDPSPKTAKQISGRVFAEARTLWRVVWPVYR